MTMEVRVIKAPEPREPKKANLLLTAAGGGLAGYALKYAIPVDKEELNQFTNSQYENVIRQKKLEAKKAEIENVKKLLKKNPDNKAADIFIRSYSEDAAVKTAANQEWKNAGAELKKQLKEFSSALSKKMELAKESTDYVLKSSAKNSRYTAGFVVPGVVLGIIGAFVYNVIGKFMDS